MNENQVVYTFILCMIACAVMAGYAVGTLPHHETSSSYATVTAMYVEVNSTGAVTHHVIITEANGLVHSTYVPAQDYANTHVGDPRVWTTYTSHGNYEAITVAAWAMISVIIMYVLAGQFTDFPDEPEAIL